MNGAAGMILYFVILIGIFYFLIIRPQRKRDKQMRNMLDALKVGDEISTIGGVIGKIVKIKDDTIVIETGSDKNRIKFEKSAVKAVIKESTQKQPKVEEKPSESTEETKEN